MTMTKTELVTGLTYESASAGFKLDTKINALAKKYEEDGWKLVDIKIINNEPSRTVALVIFVKMKITG